MYVPEGLALAFPAILRSDHSMRDMGERYRASLQLPHE